MEFLELARKRRSVRKYSSKSVPREIIDKCIEAVRLAPSACNSQPWSFIVIDDERLKNEIAQKAFSGIYSVNSFASDAPVLIAVITQCKHYAVKLGGYLRGVEYSIMDVGVACEHFMLQATEAGVGTCCLGWFDRKAVKKVLRLPAKTRLDIIISMGYSENEVNQEKIRKTIDKIRKFV